MRTNLFYTQIRLFFIRPTSLVFLSIEHLLYHATRDVLRRLDAAQHRFLKDAGVDDLTASVGFHSAPLAVRRDLAMLGVIHRTALGKGPHISRTTLSTGLL